MANGMLMIGAGTLGMAVIAMLIALIFTMEQRSRMALFAQRAK